MVIPLVLFEELESVGLIVSRRSRNEQVLGLRFQFVRRSPQLLENLVRNPHVVLPTGRTAVGSHVAVVVASSRDY